MPDHTDVPRREIDPAGLPSREMYRLLTSVVVPRPIAWVSTRGPDGVLNLAPHSYFMVLSSQPPTLLFVSTRLKDTVRNVQATGEYVINVASEDQAERLNVTSADFPPEESEFDWASLTPLPSVVVSPPGVAEAPVSIEMRLAEVREIGREPSYMVIGDAVHIRVSEAVMRGDRAAPDLLRAIGRLSGSTYCHTTALFELERPTYRGLLEKGLTPARPRQGASS